jgi:choline dehydrogenase-like flavoprotein
MPAVKISGHRHPHARGLARFLAARMQEWLTEAGASRTWTSLPGEGVSGGQHQAGARRMGNDPKTSVVDANCRLHGLDNVRVVDGSVHVNNGGFNPSLTIQAIACYASTRISPALRVS